MESSTSVLPEESAVDRFFATAVLSARFFAVRFFAGGFFAGGFFAVALLAAAFFPARLFLVGIGVKLFAIACAPRA
jgi:hypothetical protein